VNGVTTIAFDGANRYQIAAQLGEAEARIEHALGKYPSLDTSMRMNERVGRCRLFAGQNVVAMTTVVDLTRQLSNLRLEVQRLVATNTPVRVPASAPHTTTLQPPPRTEVPRRGM
jgi:hypothetical protein